jgi:uncharacterized protein DUF6345
MSKQRIRNCFRGFFLVPALCMAFGMNAALAQQKTSPQPRVTGKIPQERQTIVRPGALQIQMERAPLESPRGMKFLKIGRMTVNQSLMSDLSRRLALAPKPATAERHILLDDSGVARLQSEPEKGHMQLTPHWEKVAQAKPQLVNRQEAFRLADEFIRQNQLITKDISATTPQHLVTLSRAELRQGQTAVVTDVGQTVIFQRKIAERPVVGRGSQLLVDLGHKGEVVGFRRAWNPLTETAVQPDFKTDAQIYDEVERQVRERVSGANAVKVAKLHLIYYGNDKEYVQPAYFYSIQIDAPGVNGKSFMTGVVAAARNAPEPLLQHTTPSDQPGNATHGMNLVQPQELAEGDPTVGRYVVRNDSWDWVDDANEFKNGLNDGHSSGLPAITFGDYFWDQPWVWTSSEDSFVDRWHITLMEGHGNTWQFTTRSNCCDGVNLNASSQPGYGDLAGNSMRFLILKGCAIIPAPPDRSDWAAPWWRIFKGLHQAVGFRTEMYIDDDISYGFAKNIASNHRVLDSWFAATNGSSSYQWERFWGSWGDQIYGYGAVVMIPGREGEGIYSTAAAPPATSTGLTIWYQH